MKDMKTMREMMVAASLVAASACGAIEPVDTAQFPPDEMMEMGSGSSGMTDAGVPVVACVKASECSTGMMCDLATNECVQPTLTLDDTNLVAQGTMLWSPVSNPILHGTFDGPATVVVQVIVGSGQGTLAVMQGNEWTFQLPQGTLTSTAQWVKIMMTDASGGAVQLAHQLALDVAGPNIALASSSVKDERGDTMDFSTGEPVHTHAGADVDLAGSACPSIYKYAYLMDASVPYGTSTKANPLAWNVMITDTKIDSSTHMFRVRTDAGQTLIDWRAVPAVNADGTSTIEITRNGGSNAVPLLGTRTGKIYLDVRARDWGGTETTQSFCWDHHPLLAPVEVKPFEGDQLFDVDLAADTAAAFMLKRGDVPMGLVQQRILQHTAEATSVSWAGSVGRINYSQTTFNGWALESSPDLQTACPTGNTKPECRTNWEPTTQYPGLVTTTGTTDSLFWGMWVDVVDEETGLVIATANAPFKTSFALPPRALGAAPHAYRVRVRADYVPFHGVGSVSQNPVYADYDLLGERYSGDAAELLGTSCGNIWQTAFGPMCQLRNYYHRFTALDHFRIDFTNLNSSITQNGAPVTYVPSSVLARSSLVWDSGDDDLPGPN